MYNSNQKLVFRKDYIPNQNDGPVATVTSSGYSCSTMESMSMSEGCQSEMTMKSGQFKEAITAEDKSRFNGVMLSKDVSESTSSTNFESKLMMKSGDNQMSKEAIPSGDRSGHTARGCIQIWRDNGSRWHLRTREGHSIMRLQHG